METTIVYWGLYWDNGKEHGNKHPPQELALFLSCLGMSCSGLEEVCGLQGVGL